VPAESDVFAARGKHNQIKRPVNACDMALLSEF